MHNKYDDVALSDRLAVNLDGLQTMTGCGRPTAIKIANEAGAVVRVGGRKLYLVGKIKNYLESISDNDAKSE